MSANFTPTLHEYTDLTPFRFWCQKILPLAYDDSLSYYELLCKVVDYLNKTMEDVTLSIEDVENLHSAYVALQGYVNNYFNNLDVQQEINNKLDALVADGTIHTIFTPDVLAILNVAQQASLEAIADIPDEVAAWLAQHITQETGYVIDNTLTVSGAAADAKITGDRIDALKSDFNNGLFAFDADYVKPTFVRAKYIDATTGIVANNVKYACTYLENGGKTVAIKFNTNDYKYAISVYDSTGDIYDGTGYIGRLYSGYKNGSELTVLPMNIAKYDINVQRTDGGSMGSTEAATIKDALMYYSITDRSLTKSGMPADALAVKERLVPLEDGEKVYVLTPNFTDGKYVYRDNTLTNNSDYSYSDYVDVKPYSKIQMNWYAPSDGVYMVFLDEDRQTVIAAYNRATTPSYGSGLNTIPVPEGAAWFRTSQRTDHLSSFSLSGTLEYIEEVKTLLSAKEPTEELPCETIIRDGGFCKIFKTMGVVGDSLSSGSMHPPATPDIPVDKMWYSWIQYMARYCGNTAFNFSEGGLSARSLRYSQNEGATAIRNNIVDSDKLCNIYFVALGHNDKTYMDNHPEYTIGSISDIDLSSPDNNSNTYVGNIGWVISHIKSLTPGAKIFLITMKAEGTFGELNAALRTIPDVFNANTDRTVYLLDMATYAPRIESSWEYLLGHGSPQGYLNYSWQVSSYVDWYIRKYQSEFKLTAFNM